MLERGIPSSALNHLIAHVKTLDPSAARKAAGLSVRTAEPRNETSQQPPEAGAAGEPGSSPRRW